MDVGLEKLRTNCGSDCLRHDSCYARSEGIKRFGDYREKHDVRAISAGDNEFLAANLVEQDKADDFLAIYLRTLEHPSSYLATEPSGSTTHSVSPSISCKTRARDAALHVRSGGFDRAMAEQRSALAPPGKARPSRRPILLISSSRNPTSKAIARLALTTAKCLPSSKAAKARRNSSPANPARSSSITRPSTPNPADKSAIADGSTPTITTRSSPK